MGYFSNYFVDNNCFGAKIYLGDYHMAASFNAVSYYLLFHSCLAAAYLRYISYWLDLWLVADAFSCFSGYVVALILIS